MASAFGTTYRFRAPGTPGLVVRVAILLAVAAMMGSQVAALAVSAGDQVWTLRVLPDPGGPQRVSILSVYPAWSGGADLVKPRGAHRRGGRLAPIGGTTVQVRASEVAMQLQLLGVGCLLSAAAGILVVPVIGRIDRWQTSIGAAAPGPPSGGLPPRPDPS
ncbi:MAG: hypothetical protein ACXWZF_04775 [Actinomycetota bacterium]